MADREADQILVDKVKAGDQRAFGVLVTKYERRVIRLISRLVSNPSEQEDIAQEAFIKAYRALPQFRGDSAFYTWLYRIALNTAKNHLAARSKQAIPMSDLLTSDEDGESFQSDSVVADNQTPESILHGRQVGETVERAIEELPADLRTAVLLREVEGLSYEEIAAAMNCPIGTVRSRIFRAREAIAQKLRPLLDTREDRRW